MVRGGDSARGEDDQLFGQTKIGGGEGRGGLAVNAGQADAPLVLQNGAIFSQYSGFSWMCRLNLSVKTGFSTLLTARSR